MTASLPVRVSTQFLAGLSGLDSSTLASVLLAGAGSAAGHALGDADPSFGVLGAVLGAVLGFGLYKKV